MSWPDFPPAFHPVAIVGILLTGIAKAGFGGGAAGVAVPLMSIFIAPAEAAGIMLPILCAMDLFSTTSVAFFFVVNYVKLLPYALLGQLSAANLTASLVMAPLGTGPGVLPHRRLSERTFCRASYALLFATGAKPVYDGTR